MKTTHAIDWSVIEDLRTGEPDDDEFIRQHMKHFDSHARALLDSLDDAYERGDIEGLQLTSHSLAGAASSIGAGDLRHLCLSLEEFSESGDFLVIQGILDAIHFELDRVETELGHNESVPYAPALPL